MYVVFQMLYVIGNGKDVNFAIGKIVQKENIDLLDALIAREDEELKSGTVFE